MEVSKIRFTHPPQDPYWVLRERDVHRLIWPEPQVQTWIMCLDIIRIYE